MKTTPLLALAALGLLPAVALAHAIRRMSELPRNDPRRFVEEGQRRPGKTVVACIGASILHGRISADVVGATALRLGEGFQLVNAGLNGDLAYNALRRLPRVVDCRPDVAVILVGTNDVLGGTDPERGRRYRRWKKLPVAPTRDWYRESLGAIVATLKERTSARIAVCSLPPLGEALDSPLNLAVVAYNEVVREIAAREEIGYLPVHERMTAHLRARSERPGRDYDGAPWLMLKAMIERHVLGTSFDVIAERNGFELLTDGIHLNERAAEMVAALIADFARGA